MYEKVCASSMYRLILCVYFTYSWLIYRKIATCLLRAYDFVYVLLFSVNLCNLINSSAFFITKFNINKRLVMIAIN